MTNNIETNQEDKNDIELVEENKDSYTFKFNILNPDLHDLINRLLILNEDDYKEVVVFMDSLLYREFNMFNDIDDNKLLWLV